MERANDESKTTVTESLARPEAPTVLQTMQEVVRAQSQRDMLHANGRLQWGGAGSDSLVLTPMLVMSHNQAQSSSTLTQSGGVLPYALSDTASDNRFSMLRLGTSWSRRLDDGARLLLNNNLGRSTWNNNANTLQSGGANGGQINAAVLVGLGSFKEQALPLGAHGLRQGSHLRQHLIRAGQSLYAQTQPAHNHTALPHVDRAKGRNNRLRPCCISLGLRRQNTRQQARLRQKARGEGFNPFDRNATVFEQGQNGAQGRIVACGEGGHQVGHKLRRCGIKQRRVKAWAADCARKGHAGDALVG
jgi:hypothetical protein